MSKSSTLRRDLFALLAYLLLALVLTYPLVLHFTTHVVGDGSDDPALAWNLWWVPHAILNLGSSPIYTDYMFFPIGLNLGFYTLTYLNAFVALPIQLAFGLIPAVNINLLLSFTLSGFGAYLLVRYLLNQWAPSRVPLPAGILTPAAFAAGLVYAFSANKFLYASLGQFNIASSQWIPFYLLFLLKIFESPRPPLRYGFMLGLFLLFQALSEFIFASFLILFSLAYLLYWLIDIRFAIRNQLSKFLILFIAALTFTIPMLPILAAMISDTLTEGDFLQSGLGFSNTFSADLLGFLIPSQLHPLFGSLASQFHFAYINFVFLGYVALALALVGFIKIKRARIWGLWFVLIFLITLGPTLRINGAEFNLPFLPFNALLEIPFIKGNRYPSRWSVMLTLCLVVLVGYGLAWMLEAVSKQRSAASESSETQSTSRNRLTTGGYLLAGGLSVLLVFEHLSAPLPLTDFRIPTFYEQMAQDAGNFSVMEIPLAWRNGFRVTGSYRADSQAPIDRSFMLAQWYQTAQQHPILNGNTSRNPELKFQYFSETPVLNSIIAIQEGHTVDDATRAMDKELAPRLLQFFGTRYVVWHTPYEDANQAVAEKTRAYIENIFPMTKVSESYENGRGTVVYRVNELPGDDTLVLTPTDPLARLYLGEGWGALGGDDFLVQRDEAKILLPLTEVRKLTLRLRGVTPYGTQDGGLAVRVNGKPVAKFNTLPATNGIASTLLPVDALHAGMNEITLAFDKLAPVPREGTPPTIVIRSAGEEQGSFGHIYVNGWDESPNQRGYNVVVIDPQAGTVKSSANFDTFASEAESARMAEFIAQIPNDSIVAVAASDEASAHLTQDAVNALASLGAKLDLRGKFRWSHALLATKGKPASAQEAASETRVSQIISGAGLTEPKVAASIGEIDVEPAP